MFISKVKSYNNISISEIKDALRIVNSDSTYDSELLSLIPVGVSAAEAFINRSIVYTINNIEDYNISGCYYCLSEPEIALSAITSTSTDGTVTSIAISGVSIYKNVNTTILKFAQSLNAHKLNIVYTSGYSTEIPAPLRRSIIIKVKEFLDQSDTYIPSSMVNSKAFERLLSPWILLK